MEKKIKRIIFGSAFILGVVMIVTQSLYMAAFDSTLTDNIGGVEEFKTRAIVGIVFAVFGLLFVLGAINKARKDGWVLDKSIIISLAFAVVLLIVSAAVTIKDQKDMYDAMKEAQDYVAQKAQSSYGSYGSVVASQAIPTKYVDASHVFFPNVVFMPICSLFFVAGAYYAYKNNLTEWEPKSIGERTIDFKNKNVIILTSLSVLSFVFLIMGSIYLGQIDKTINNDNYNGAPSWEKTYALGAPATAVALSAISLITSLWMISNYRKDGEMSSTSIFTSILTMIMLAIAFALTTQGQYGAFQSIGSADDALQKAACVAFPINLSFMLVCGLGFIYGSYKHFKEEF